MQARNQVGRVPGRVLAQVRIVECETAVGRDRAEDHRAAMLDADVGFVAIMLIVGWNEEYFIQVLEQTRLFGNEEMPVMDRIESAAKNSSFMST